MQRKRNKLLAISVLLLYLDLYGADKPKVLADVSFFSIGGLEGWGKKEGVFIVVEDCSKSVKNFDVKAIENQVELKLRLAGIRVVDKNTIYTIHIIYHPVFLGE